MLLLALDAAPACARPNHFEVTRDRAGYRVDASADLAADPAVVWGTLTDYEKLPQFVPGVRSVRVLETRVQAGHQHLVIEQSGELRFLFFSRRIVVLLDVEQEPRTRITARALPRPQIPDTEETNLNEFEGEYTLVPIPGGVRLAYRARFAPGFALPPIFGTFAVRRSMQAQFEAMLVEIGRRQSAPALRGLPQ